MANNIPPGFVEYNDYSHRGFVSYVPKCNFCNWQGAMVKVHESDTAGVREKLVDKIWNHARQFHKIQMRKEYGM